jgi:hypothetical protein
MEAPIMFDDGAAPWRCAWCGASREEDVGSVHEGLEMEDNATDGICEGCLTRELSQLALVRATEPELLTGLRLRRRRRRAA